MARILQGHTQGGPKCGIFLWPVPAVELMGAFAAQEDDGLPRRREGADFAFPVHCVPYPVRSGGGTYLTVCQRPQVQAGTVNATLQCAYRAAGRASSFLVTLLFDSDHTKGFLLFPRQAM